MKKMWLLLLLTTAGKGLFAQIVEESYVRPLSSDAIFNSRIWGQHESSFYFMLLNNNTMIIRVSGLEQVDAISNPDSLFQKIWQDLDPMKDSLSDPLIIKRVDYFPSMIDTKIRITRHQPKATYYSYKDDELVQMKVDQDTIVYKGLAPVKKTTIGDTQRPEYGYYTITLILNNLSDLAKFPDNILKSSLALLMKDTGPVLKSNDKKRISLSYYAEYNVQKQERITTHFGPRYQWFEKNELIPYVQLGIQYGRGSAIPSVATGLTYGYYSHGRDEKNVFMLMWEPYFFFLRDSNNKLSTNRNDFITFRYHNTSKSYSFEKKISTESYLNFSIGYLIRRRGNWFEPHTFKFSVPGLQFKNALLEPEFFFNDFFKHFSPSLKLTVYLE